MTPKHTPIDDGGPMFPRGAQPGISVRLWLAGQAMAGMLADDNDLDVEDVTINALEHADDLIAADKQSRQTPKPEQL